MPKILSFYLKIVKEIVRSYYKSEAIESTYQKFHRIDQDEEFFRCLMNKIRQKATEYPFKCF